MSRGLARAFCAGSVRDFDPPMAGRREAVAARLPGVVIGQLGPDVAVELAQIDLDTDGID